MVLFKWPQQLVNTEMIFIPNGVGSGVSNGLTDTVASVCKQGGTRIFEREEGRQLNQYK